MTASPYGAGIFQVGCAVVGLLTLFWLRRLGVGGRYLREWAGYGRETPPPDGPSAPDPAVSLAPASPDPAASLAPLSSDGRVLPICALVPVLEETRRLEACVRHLLRLGQDYPDYTVAIVTSEAEFRRHERTTAGLIESARAARRTSELERLVATCLPGAEPAGATAKDAAVDLEGRRAVVEDLIRRRPTTVDLARSLADRFPRIRVYHKTGDTGHMAHQLNAGIRAHVASAGRREILFALYNADSRPDSRTLSWVLDRLARQSDSRPTPVFQQYGLYLGNYAGLLEQPWPARAVLTAAGCWQTRWSIGFEIPNALRQFAGGGRAVASGRLELGRLPALNYCVGHGLFFSYETYLRFGGFSETTYSEDALFGLQASYHGLPIVPVPLLEVADSPETIRSLVIQKSTWFWGPFQAFRYAAMLRGREADGPRLGGQGRERRKRESGRPPRWRLWWLTLRLFEHAVIWVAGPTLLAALLVYAIATRDWPGLVLSLGLAELYLVLPNVLALGLCRRVATEAMAGVRPGSEGLRQLVGAPLAYLLHGASAYRTMLRALRAAATGVPAAKERTPLRGQAPP